MPVRKTADQATQNWVQHLSAATQQITDGVGRVNRAPGAAAAAQKQRWFARLTASQDKWARNVAAVPLQEWQQAMINVGIPRIAQGAQAKQGKFTNFMQSFLPYLQQGVARVDAMPNVTLEDSIARSAAMIRHNAGFQNRGGAGRQGP